MGRDAVIEAEVNDLCGVLNAQHARLVDLVVELLADRGLWQGEGVWTMPAWLAWRCGVSSSTARRVVLIAGRVEDLPVCVAAFRAGELSLDQMAAIAQRAPWWTDRQVCTLGRLMTVSQIRRMLGAYPFADFDDDGKEIHHRPPDSDADTGTDGGSVGDGGAVAVGGDGVAASVCGSPRVEDAPVDVRDPHVLGQGTAGLSGNAAALQPFEEWLSMGHDDSGAFRLQMVTDTATGSVIESALVEARDRLFHDGQTDVSWVDALREVADVSLDQATPVRRNRFRISLHLDVDGRLTNGQRRRLPVAIARHVCCDGTITPVLSEQGRPVSVGRLQRVVPARTRTVVEYRDHGGCRVPGCDSSRWLEIHHIVHWQDGGPTDPPNLITLCAHHHRQHHRGNLRIDGDADLEHGANGAVEFTDRSGRLIDRSGARPTPPTSDPPQPSGRYEHPCGERLDSRWLYFNPPDVLGLTRPRRTAHSDDDVPDASSHAARPTRRG